jgi:hypothetical protein
VQDYIEAREASGSVRTAPNRYGLRFEVRKGNVKTAMSRSPKVTQIEIGASFEGFKISISTIRQLKSRTHFETDIGTGMQVPSHSPCFCTWAPMHSNSQAAGPVALGQFPPAWFAVVCVFSLDATIVAPLQHRPGRVLEHSPFIQIHRSERLKHFSF